MIADAHNFKEKKRAKSRRHLKTCVKTAQDLLHGFNERIQNKEHDTHLIPIAKILKAYEYIDCTAAKTDDIVPAIKDAIKEFSSRLVADGIANLVANIIGKLLGESSGSRKLQQQYFISTDPLGSIFRPDALFFVYKFSSDGLLKTAKSVAACCVVKFSADVRDIDDNTLRILVNQCFETSPMDLHKAIYSELHEALFNSKDPKYVENMRHLRLEQAENLKEFSGPRAIENGAVKAQFVKQKNGQVEQRV